ncbi:hypothetical protein IWQ57_002024 [Coemansia nantahalensis]|uniref:Uncharacterized protein n=1 Tax=Coemansia nantahalensis TaxID=2789366 RepID=A0ACC1K250_9FUNG|nr:hypothetical protein IWQ57_002024 [Coemansia nantahalensis]
MEFDSRSFTPPACHAVPRAKFAVDGGGTGKRKQSANPVYRNVSGGSHAQSLAELAQLAAGLGKRSELWQDQALLQRIFYRNWNQHRGSLYYRRLYELRRVLRVLAQTRIRELLEHLLASFYDPAARRKDRKASAWTALPCALFAAKVAGRMALVAKLASKVQQASMAVYVQFAAQTAQTLFMPLALVVQGLAARIFLVAAQWHQDLVAVYVLLAKWLLHLPACPDTLQGRPVDVAAGLPAVDDLRLPLPLDAPPVEAVRRAAAAPASLSGAESCQKGAEPRPGTGIFMDEDIGDLV